MICSSWNQKTYYNFVCIRIISQYTKNTLLFTLVKAETLHLPEMEIFIRSYFWTWWNVAWKFDSTFDMMTQPNIYILSCSCRDNLLLIVSFTDCSVFSQWSKLSSTSQQLGCMQRHAEGCVELWNKQTTYGSDTTTVSSSSTTASGNMPSTSATNDDQQPGGSNSGGGATGTSLACDNKKKAIINAKPTDWVVIPVFADIVRLAVVAREDCLRK